MDEKEMTEMKPAREMHDESRSMKDAAGRRLKGTKEATKKARKEEQKEPAK